MAQLERDDALLRLGRTRRLLIVGVAAATAAVAAAVSAAAPGHTLGKRTASAAGATSTGAPLTTSKQMPPLAGPGALGLQGPASAPQSSSSQSSQSGQSQSSQPAQPSAPAPSPAPVSGGS